MDQEKETNANDELKKIIEENTEKIIKELLEETDKNFTSDCKVLQILIEANTEKLIQEIIIGLPCTGDCREEMNDKVLKMVQENTKKILNEIVYEFEANEKALRHSESQKEKNALEMLIEKNTEELLQELIRKFEAVILPGQHENNPLLYPESIQAVN